MELVMTTERPRLGHGNAKRARQIAGLLAGRVLTISQIAEESGMTRDAAARALWRLRCEMDVPVICVGEAEYESGGQGGNHGASLYTVLLPLGRICAHEGCGTVLCRRNPSEFCAVHGGWSL